MPKKRPQIQRSPEGASEGSTDTSPSALLWHNQQGAARALFEALPAAALILDDVGYVVDANSAAAKQLQLPRAALTQRSLSDLLMTSETEAEVTLSALLSLGPDLRVTLRNHCVSPCPFIATVQANVWPHRHLLMLRPEVLHPLRAGLQHDCRAEPPSPRQAADAAATDCSLLEQFHLQAAALDACADVIVITDVCGTIQWANPAFSHLTGYTVAEAVGKNPRDLVNSGQQDAAFFQQLWRTILAGDVWRGELVNRRKDGSFYAEEMTITPVRNTAQVITHFIAIKQDISDRKRVEVSRQVWRQRLDNYARALEDTNAALALSEQRYRDVVDMQTDMVCRFTADGTLTFVNDAYCEFFQRSADVLIGQRFIDLVPESERDLVEQQLHDLQSLQPDTPTCLQDHPVQDAAGNVHWQQWINRALFDDRGQLVEFQATGRDITELKTAEAALRQRESMLNLFFSQSLDGFFFMMLDEPVRWDDTVDKAAVLDYVFAHQRITKANQAMADQYGLSHAEILGITPADFFAYDLVCLRSGGGQAGLAAVF